MPLGTLDSAPPPFFRQGASALSRLLFFSALSLFLMVADARFNVTGPMRLGIATALYPVQWLLLQPVQWVRGGVQHVESLRDAWGDAQTARYLMRMQAPRLIQFEQLQLENERLRGLLAMRQRLPVTGTAAQVLYDAADPYEHKVIIDKGMLDGVSAGSPVLDESGVLGQVTRVYPSVSEVTLVVDADQAVPIVNTRTGVRAVVFGNPARHGGALELRYMGVNADVQAGDLLATSGVDGVYPAGLPVARVLNVVRRVEQPFAQIDCAPQARVDGASYVLVLPSLEHQLPPRPGTASAAPSQRDGGKERSR